MTGSGGANLSEEVKNEIWHVICNAERMLRFTRNAIVAGEKLTLGQEEVVKKVLDELQDVKSHFNEEE
jgi:hypothetical protein